MAGGIELLTQLFGRFYCSTICPYEFLQEIAAFYTFDKDFIIEKIGYGAGKMSCENPILRVMSIKWKG